MKISCPIVSVILILASVLRVFFFFWLELNACQKFQFESGILKHVFFLELHEFEIKVICFLFGFYAMEILDVL